MTTAIPTIHTALEDELDRLWRFALHLTNCTETAEALVRRTFATAIARRHQYPTRRQWRNWLIGLEFRLWREEIRRARANLQSITSETQSPCVKPPGAPFAGCLNSQLCHTINQLPEAQRLVMLLICVEEFSYLDTAEILDLPIDTVTARLTRARISIGLLQRRNAKPTHHQPRIQAAGSLS